MNAVQPPSSVSEVFKMHITMTQNCLFVCIQLHLQHTLVDPGLCMRSLQHEIQQKVQVVTDMKDLDRIKDSWPTIEPQVNLKGCCASSL